MKHGVDKKIVTWAALTVAALLVTGCGGTAGADTAPAEPSATAKPSAPATAPAGGKNPDRAPGQAAEAAAAYRKWGLKPFAAPPAPPKTKPVKRRPGDPVPVISEIPTRDKIVFITIDDGAEKDPEFVTMMKDLKVPVTMFLTDSAIRTDYRYFEPLAALGNGVANHTLTHPNLRTLGRAAQRQEICGQQTKLAKEYGTTPRLFRPPYGNWNEDTRAAAGTCGVDAIVLWRESMQIRNMQYQRGDRKLHPGDIILAHFRGPAELKGTTMTRMTADMLRRIQEQGFTVARLEDYV
ncbi:polysaccharide deacetylase family protein [Streptomyces sp. Je 1-79]|uniref:polysaccharide deacetylase family protein n=1 Tax=Streptomyces sp. Je 1-79 TaxID=2943847 RepID=UPI0021A4DE7D|nr:polysaccharide deacetylase family protein [Streptomyces sp. Je 1-79]MCT4355758.1 polysaccharide deacetylase family protein [Streptomyces sp. Je 1-79]